MSKRELPELDLDLDDDDDDDPLDAARGIWLGVMLGSALWTLLIFYVWGIV